MSTLPNAAASELTFGGEMDVAPKLLTVPG